MTRLRFAAKASLPLLLLLGVALYWLWPDLDHPAIHRWDEGIHQIATRELHDTGVPMVYSNPLVAEPFETWPSPHIFLHKPTLPFALGALLQWLLGITPLALRLVSFAGMVAAAFATYLFGRRVVGSALALALAAALLALPFGYMMVQGWQFGDATDCSLIGFLALSVWVLGLAAERDSAALAAAAGALCGGAFLCKSALGLLPLGVAGALCVLGALGLGPRVRLHLFLWFAGLTVVVALPWNLYTAVKWPDLFRWEARYTLAFLKDDSREWAKPLFAVFTDVNREELSPWPPAIFPLAGVWLLWAAWRRRTLHLWMLCLWLWGEWIPLTLATVKVPAHAWGALPAVLLAVGLLLRDSLQRPWLGAAAIAALATGLDQPAAATPLMEHPPRAVARAGWHFMPRLLQLAKHPGWAEDIAVGLLVAAAMLAGWWLLRGSHRRQRRAGLLLGSAAVVLAGWFGFVQSSKAMALTRAKELDPGVDSYGPELGAALERALPANAILFVTTRDPACCLATQSLMFYSGFQAYPAKQELVQLARLEGFHPYLVSGIAQPFEPVAAVPANAWLQAYDLDAPRVAPAELPADLARMHRTIGSAELLGVALSHGDSSRDRYLFYLRSPALAPSTSVTFTLTDGTTEHQSISRRRALDWPISSAGDKTFRLAHKTAKPDDPPPPATTTASVDWITSPGLTSWYTLAVPGPPRARLKRMQLLGADVPLP